jgi:transposase-like protein
MIGIAMRNQVDSVKRAWIEAILSNDEASSDSQLMELFMDEGGLSESEARSWVLKRDSYLRMENAAETKCPKCGGETSVVTKDGKRACMDCRWDERNNGRENANFRCICGGSITGIGEDRWECDECGQIYESDDWGRGRLKAVNAGELGYGATTTTSTTAKSKRKISQKFYTVSNMLCPACGEDCNGIGHLREHLMADHNMSQEQAEDVMMARVNGDDDWVKCPKCGAAEGGEFIYSKDGTSHYRCDACKEKFERQNAADVYVPPLLTLAQRVAAGQKQYGAINAVSVCSACDHAKANHPDWNDGKCSAPGCDCSGYKA